MKCQTIRRDASAHIDGMLEGTRAQVLRAHLRECAECAQYVENLRSLVLTLKELPRPAVPARLTQDILEAVDALPMGRPRWLARLIPHLVRLVVAHPQVVSLMASVVITSSLMLAILANFTPLPVIPVASHRPQITLTPVEYRLLNQGRVPSSATGVYTLPRLRQGGNLDALFAATQSDEFALITVVHPDGRASVVDVLTPPASSRILAQANESLQELRFQPAMNSGRPVSTQLVMLVQRLDVMY